MTTLLHGFTQRGSNWTELAFLLPGMVIVTPDLRGHGANPAGPGEPHTMDSCTNDVIRLWDEAGIERSHLIGYSMGGRLALHLATRHPNRLLSLATIGSHAGLEGSVAAERRLRDEELADAIEARGIEWFVAHWSELPLFTGLSRRGPDFIARVRDGRLRNRPEGLAASLRGMGPGAAPPLWDDLDLISCPALFIAGELDSGYPDRAARMAAGVRHGRAVTIEGAGHAAHLEDPQAVAAALRPHLGDR